MPSQVALREALMVLNDMESQGVIGRYAICGAIAAFRYIEPATTQDLDISVYLPGVSSPIVTLSPITDYLAQTGRPIQWNGEGIVIGVWPVQFLTAADPLDQAALDSAELFDFDGTPTRLWRIEYLMAKCLQVGRLKDHARLEQFLEEPFDRVSFCDILSRFDLKAKWSDLVRANNWRDICDSHA